MTTNNYDASEFLKTVRHHQRQQNFHEARRLLTAEKDTLVQTVSLSNLLSVIQAFPRELLQTSPHLLWLQANALTAQNKLGDAIAAFEQARLLYVQQGNSAYAARCALKLARLYHRLEDLGVARLYTERAVDLVRSLSAQDEEIRLVILLGIARLSPDIGMYAEGEAAAREALQLYETRGDAAGRCDVLLMLFRLANQLGRSQEARGYLDMARQQQQLASLGAAHQVAFLNCEAHWAWYRGEITAALSAAQRSMAIADRSEQPKQAIYARLIVANLQRAAGNFAEAARWYDATEQLIENTGFDLFLSWVQVHRAWLHILRQEYAEARRLLDQALETQDRGQVASFQVFLAVLYSLHNRYAEAEELLQDSFKFFVASGDVLSICTLRLHLAHIYLRTQRNEAAQQALTEAFDWMAEHNRTYLPHWWHPPIVIELCLLAMRVGIRPALAERILAKHIGPAAIPAVSPLLSHADATVRRRAHDLLSLLQKRDPLADLGPVDGPVRAVLTALLQSNQLLADGLPQLAALLSTADNSNEPNPTLIAVFGLFVHGASRKEIAQRLSVSPSTVKNYVTHIYNLFALPYDPQNRQQRWETLRALAERSGYISTTVPGIADDGAPET